LGQAIGRREGSDLTIVAVGVDVHRGIAAAEILATRGISAGVIDLRTVTPLDRPLILEAVGQTGRLLVVDEDYRDFGLSGELAAVVAEEGIPFRFARVCTQGTIPYSRAKENETLPSTARIVEAAQKLAAT